MKAIGDNAVLTETEVAQLLNLSPHRVRELGCIGRLPHGLLQHGAEYLVSKIGLTRLEALHQGVPLADVYQAERRHHEKATREAQSVEQRIQAEWDARREQERRRREEEAQRRAAERQAREQRERDARFAAAGVRLG